MPLSDFISAAVPTAISAATQIGSTRRQYKYNTKLAQQANAMNRQNMAYAYEMNQKELAKQLEYDSPEMQMERYMKAGLNPHLIYGQGSSGNQGSPIQFGQAPGVNMGNVDASLPDIGGNFIRAMQANAGLGLTEAKTVQTTMQSQLTAMQTEIAKTNPMLNPQVADRVAMAMQYVAEQKYQESSWMTTRWSNEKNSLAERKVMAEITALEQRLGLNTADLRIRNQIFESKEFENAIKEIQTKWLKDATITPEHIRQGLMMLLGKMVGR